MRKKSSAIRPAPLEAIRHRLRYSKRLLVNRRGDGVHSPFAYRFISQIVRSRYPYYCFAELAPQHEGAGRGKRGKRERRLCELLFRTAHELGIRRILHLGKEGTLLGGYLMRTGYTEEFVSVSSLADLPVEQGRGFGLLVVEDASSLPMLQPYLGELLRHSPDLLLAGYTLSRGAYQQWVSLQRALPARLGLDLLDLQLAFYDERLTPSSYKALC